MLPASIIDHHSVDSFLGQQLASSSGPRRLATMRPPVYSGGPNTHKCTWQLTEVPYEGLGPSSDKG